MNHQPGNGQLTFGALVADTYGACERRRATALIRFAVNAGVLSLPHVYTGGRPRSTKRSVGAGAAYHAAKACGAVAD